MLKNKKGAMEMSVGTIVTIVLLMTVLILGLVLVRSIFFSATTSVEGIDKAVKNEIGKLFSEDSSKKLVMYPSTGIIELEKGKAAGFAFAIRNVNSEPATISYTITASKVEESCPITLNEAEKLISLGRKGDVKLEAGSIMDEPVFIRYSIPENAPPCQIRYAIDLTTRKDGVYGSTQFMDVVILSE